ncbi:hypothetical protein [Actinoplanes couchii]|nr:hypothetical protein [Actinoplanes couchii]MDR6326452.1 hypothetical protein [Actinoplanes couchii]
MSSNFFIRRPGVAVLVGLAAVGLSMSVAGPGAASPGSTYESYAGSRTSPQDTQAVSVSIQRTRGANNISSFQISGSGNAYSNEVLKLASSPAFRALGPRYAPASKSGRYRYDVTVNYRNGWQKRIVTYSKTPGTPQVLVDLIKKTETVKVKVRIPKITIPKIEFPPGFPFN